MANKRTDKSCYESHYGGEWITAAKHLAELACERIAGDATLGNRFWMNQPWKNIFIREITHANRLLATPFAVEAILKAWVSREGKRVLTLGAPFFKPLIELEQRKLDLMVKEKSVTPLLTNTLEIPRPIKRVDRSIREKLTNNGSSKGGDEAPNRE